MKSFKQYIEEQKHVTKEISPLQGLVATMPTEVMIGDKIELNIIDKAIKKPVS
jgi:hypothetical protein